MRVSRRVWYWVTVMHSEQDGRKILKPGPGERKSARKEPPVRESNGEDVYNHETPEPHEKLASIRDSWAFRFGLRAD